MNTEIFSHMNWLAILVATLAYFVIGALWYSKVLFGSKWASLLKLDLNDPNQKKGMGQMMLSSFILMLITCIGLSILIVKVNFDSNYMYGIKIGLLTGICYASTAVSINYVYARKPLALYFINNGYHIAGQLIAAVILVMWR